MKSILIDYQKSASICDCVIHILVLLAQIGIQSRLSILRSNILECIDGVSLLHVDRFSLQNNIFSLFLELCDSDFSADILVSCRCFDICVKTLERVLRNENEDSDGQVTLKALRVIQSVASEGSNAMGPFLSTGGYGVLIQLWKATSGRLDVQLNLLETLLRLLQHEDGNKVLAPLQVPDALLNHPDAFANRLLVAPIWSCIRFYVQRHSPLLKTASIQLILTAAVRYGKEFAMEEEFVFHLSWTLFTLTSLRSTVSLFRRRLLRCPAVAT